MAWGWGVLTQGPCINAKKKKKRKLYGWEQQFKKMFKMKH